MNMFTPFVIHHNDSAYCYYVVYAAVSAKLMQANKWHVFVKTQLKKL